MRRFLPTAPIAPAVLIASLIAVFAAALPAFPAQAADGASWSVAPADTEQGTARPNFDYAMDPGQTLADAYAVRNDGATPLTLRVYASDAFTTREGNIDLLPAAEPASDAGTWVRLDVDQVTLQPGETSVIPFTVTAPADARPGDHVAGIVASITSADPTAEVQVDRRLGTRMYIRLSGELTPAVQLSEPVVEFTGGWNPLAVGNLTVRYTLQNTGDTRVTALSALSASGPFGAAAISTADVQLPEVLPGSEIDVLHELTGVGALLWLAGGIDVRPSSVGIGAAALDAQLLDYSVAAVPFGTLAVLLLVALVVLVTLLVVRRRRTASARSTAAPAAR